MRRSRSRAERRPIPKAGRARTPCGFAALCAALMGLVGGLTGCEDDPEITLRPVELVDPIAEEPLDLDPLLAPPPLDCLACAAWEVELVGGDRVRVRGRKEPAMRIAPEQIAFVELVDEGGRAASEALRAAKDRAVEPFVDPAPVPTRYSVYAVLAPAEREAYARFLATGAAGHGRRFLLVELAGRPVDLVRPLGLVRGVRIGAFADASSRRAYVGALSFPVRSVRPPDG